MVTIWRPITDGNYRVKKGDVLTLYGEAPEDVWNGHADHGYIISSGTAGMRARSLWSDYDEDEEPTVWTKREQLDRIRLALNKVFSEPLPLP